MVYDRDQKALTDLVREFGFGSPQASSTWPMRPASFPMPPTFEKAERWDGEMHPYGPFDQIQLAIGQGSYLGTPLQLANAYAAIGNGGRLWTPRIVVEARLPDGTLVERNPRQLTRRISMQAARPRLRDRVDEGGRQLFLRHRLLCVRRIRHPGRRQVGHRRNRHPDPRCLVPGHRPANDARIAAATVLVHVPLATGGSDAAPLVRRVFATYFAGG